MAFDRAWQRFNGGPNESLKSRVHVTINRFGNVLLNQRAFERLGRPEAVNLYYNPDLDSIGLESASPRLPQAFPIKAQGKAGGWRINAAPFLRHFGIQLDKTYRFINPRFQGVTVELRLTEITAVGGYTRKGKRADVQ